MAAKKDYSEKFSKINSTTAFGKLDAEQQHIVKDLAFKYRFTQQELRQVVEIGRDLAMWGEGPLSRWISETGVDGSTQNGNAGKDFLKRLNSRMDQLRRQAKVYPKERLNRPRKREKNKIVQIAADKKIFGMCPVASPRTVCCNLRTINAVENCVFGCSYCTIQTFYSDRVQFDDDLQGKLQRIELDPQRRYHFGTGQSSDSLAWGDRFHNLQYLCDWARTNPNVMLEFKTKSDNVQYFLENEIPGNVLCTWSLNPETIVDNEEHFTAPLAKRLAAARAVADRGIKVGFHFHPMIYYNGWDHDYPEIATAILNNFSPHEVLIISFGSVTFIKPVMKKIRDTGMQSKILQMPLVPDPHGKLTYDDDLKVGMFSRQFAAFSAWHSKVFFYLCMEKAEIWQRSFGKVWATNDEFEEAMLDACFKKINVE